MSSTPEQAAPEATNPRAEAFKEFAVRFRTENNLTRQQADFLMVTKKLDDLIGQLFKVVGGAVHGIIPKPVATIMLEALMDLLAETTTHIEALGGLLTTPTDITDEEANKLADSQLKLVQKFAEEFNALTATFPSPSRPAASNDGDVVDAEVISESSRIIVPGNNTLN